MKNHSRITANVGMLLLLLCSLRLAQGQESNIPNTVADNFPQSLVERFDGDPDRRSCYAVYSMDANGHATSIVAGYAAGALVFLKSDAGQYKPIAQVSADNGLYMSGSSCNIELVDLDGDGKKEVHAAFQFLRGAGGSSDWYFRWDGASFKNLTPVNEGETSIFSSRVEDIDGDGLPEVIAAAHNEGTTIGEAPYLTPLTEVFTMSQEGLQLRQTFAYMQTFVRDEGKPVVKHDDLVFRAKPDGRFLVKVMNGAPGNKNRVSSAHIALNGVEIVSPSRLSQQVELVSAEVSLGQENRLEVQLDGKPGSFVRITVESLTQAPGP